MITKRYLFLTKQSREARVEHPGTVDNHRLVTYFVFRVLVGC
jgi:hypothetical protein